MNEDHNLKTVLKWFNYGASENTRKPKDPLPLDLVKAFENA